MYVSQIKENSNKEGKFNHLDVLENVIKTKMTHSVNEIIKYLTYYLCYTFIQKTTYTCVQILNIYYLQKKSYAISDNGKLNLTKME